jgi:EmrB/QacA subfamily drug resistance transporter
VALYVAGASALLVGLNTTVMNVVFPSIEADFANVSRSTVAWGISGYSIALAALTLFGGWGADRFGRRRAFTAGLAVFAIGSVIGALAGAVGWFIAARLVQAIGAAMLSPASLSMVLPLFPTERKAMAISIWAAIGYLGSALSPSFAALMTDLRGWRFIFVLFAIGAVVVGAVAPRFLPADGPRTRTGRVDVVGAPAGAFGLGLAALSVIEGPKTGWNTPTLVAMCVGAALLVVFVRRSLSHDEPLVDLRMFRPRAVWSAIVANLFITASGIAVWVVYPLFLVQRWGWSLTRVGVALTPIPLSAGVAAIVGGRLTRRFGSRRVVMFGSILPMLGMAWLALRLTDDPHYVRDLLPGSVLFNIGFGLTFAPLNASALTGVPEHLLGQASAVISTVRQLAGGLGVALMIALLGDADTIAASRFDLVFLTLAAIAAGTTVVVGVFSPLKTTTSALPGGNALVSES